MRTSVRLPDVRDRTILESPAGLSYFFNMKHRLFVPVNDWFEYRAIEGRSSEICKTVPLGTYLIISSGDWYKSRPYQSKAEYIFSWFLVLDQDVPASIKALEVITR